MKAPFWMPALILTAATSWAGAQDDGPPRIDIRVQPKLPVGSVVIEEPPKGAQSIMVNGDLEEADDQGQNPRGWQHVDNLVYSWATDPASPERGKVIKIDTDVQQKQGYEWWTAHYLHGAELDKAPAKLPTIEPKYDTIAGLDGGFYWSDYIPIKPGRAYKVYVDAKGPGSKVFIRGYAAQPGLSFADESPAVQQLFREARGEPNYDAKGKQVRYFPRYKYSTWFAVGGNASEWKTYTHARPRHPTGREMTEDVRYIRIMLYPYWPPATYWYDNIRVYEVDPEPEGGRPKADQADFEEGKVVK
jgi:hypothetical protein